MRKARDSVMFLQMKIKQLQNHVKLKQLDQIQSDYVKLWKQQSHGGHSDAELTRSKIKFNHLIFTKLSKTLYSNLMKSFGSLVFKNTNEMLYTDKVPLTKCFYIVLYGSFTLLANGG